MSNLPPFLSNSGVMDVQDNTDQDAIEVYFEHISDAAVVINISDSSIIRANTKFLQLTELSITTVSDFQINGQPFHTVLSSLSIGEDHEITLTRGVKEPIHFIARLVKLAPHRDEVLVKFVSLDKYLEDHNELWDNKVKGIVALANISEAESLDAMVEQIFNVAKLIFNVDIACIYTAQSDIPELKSLASIGDRAEEFFPKTLSAKNLVGLSKTKVWQPEMRVSMDLHRKARKINMRYLASVPIGQENSAIGVLILGDFKRPASPMISKFLEIFSAHVTTAFSRYLLLSNLKKGSENLQHRIEMRNTIFENSIEGILIVDPQSKVIEINPAAENMLGYSNGEVCGEPVENVLIGADLLSDALSSAKRGISTHNMGDVALHMRDGRSFPAHLQIIPVVLDKDVKAMMVFVTDVSEMEQSQLRTRQLEHRALLGEFTSVFAHEVRNPINNISTGVQLLSGKLDADDPNQDVLTRIQGDCVRLNHLMESVLSFSRPMDMDRLETVNLAKLLKRVMDRWQPRFERVNITHFFQVDEDVPCVRGVSKDLERVFVNLISNAVDVMEETGGTLAVRINFDKMIASKPQIEVTVSDNGPGIPNEVRERIFEPFVTTRAQGTGLGLAITKQIITAHRGSIPSRQHQCEHIPGRHRFSCLFTSLRWSF
jgi:PAS domain S-box-containing protein